MTPDEVCIPISAHIHILSAAVNFVVVLMDFKAYVLRKLGTIA